MRAILAAAVLLLPSALAASAAEAPGVMAPGAMALVRADRWVEAAEVAARLPDPVAGKLVAFFRMLAPLAAGVTEIDAFRAANPQWPLQATLLRRRDEAILAEPDDAVAVAACARTAPRRAQALLRCADGERREGLATAEAAARAAWVATAPNPSWDTAFLRSWSGAIRAADQWARFDRLAWSDTAAARLQLPLLSAADRQEATVRLALRGDDPQAADLLAGLPPEQRDAPAMMLEDARWLRRRGRTTEAAALWSSAPGLAAERAAPEGHRAAFWDERNILARTLLGQGDPGGAYALAAGAAQGTPETVADAAFLAGWIALRRLGDPGRAQVHFSAIAAVSRAAITQARAHYWLGRATAAAGDSGGARLQYHVAANYPSTFYGQLAALAAGEEPAQLQARIVARRDPGWDSAQAASFADDELVRASAWLVGWGEPGRAAAFLLRQSELQPSAPVQSLAARLASGYAMPQTAVALARLAGRSGVVLLDSGWPVAARVAPDAAVDPALALGVIRQESSFDPAVVSPAGARGLMQLMPGTAAAQARALGVADSVAELTEDAHYNVQLGSAYLTGLLARFGGSVPLAAAAYNAGPARVTAWLAANGDPRSHPGGLDGMIDWIELIPFSETRNYVQRVIENAVVYQAKLGEAAAFPMPWQRSPA